MPEISLSWVAAAAALVVLGPRAWQRLQLSRAKHPSLAGHSRWAKRLAAQIPGYAYDEAAFFGGDGAPPEVVARRRAGLRRLGEGLAARSPRTLALTAEARERISDLQLTARYRVPSPYGDILRAHVQTGAFLRASRRMEVEDLDGQRWLDVAGSYGVNLLGYDTLKRIQAEGAARVADLGPVLGAYHPVVADNARRLCAISGQDEVSFHMSGTEAVMQAVRLARYHTGRSHLVRFCGAYHGWWEDVQPGPGNPMPPRETYTLRDMDERSLQVLRSRRDIACVLVNPLQALHPNANAPADSALIDGTRRAGFDRAATTAWLQRLRQVCTERGIALIFDEVFMGFRLGVGGAQDYFGVRADLVTYGKALGGLPVGVVCGGRRWMRRYREDRPGDLCFARGTFNAHPLVMGAMAAFLDTLEQPATRALYENLEERWAARAERFNLRLREAGLSVQVAAMGSVFTVLYTKVSRYHWMLQFYLREAGLMLSWVGTGRMVFSLDTSDEEFDAVIERFVQGARTLQAEGWWWTPEGLDARGIRRTVLRELLRARGAELLARFGGGRGPRAGRHPVGDALSAPHPSPAAGHAPDRAAHRATDAAVPCDTAGCR